MIVTILRHGKAGDASRDEDRELTDRGIDDISFGSHRLRDLCTDKSLPFPSQIFHSNWRRTTQTAEIVEAAFTASIEPMDALLPGSTIADVDRAMSQLPTGDSHCVLVGHQPMVSTLVDYYLGDPGRVPPLKPGGLASFRFDVPARGCGELLFWAMPPEYRGDV
ncbi:MAG: histidine phosphatase family protein [Proteobacteria bacterium]|nr:histidine phosphatase family protein [Pseudomonadota bacterium]